MRRHHHNFQAKIVNPSSRFRPCFFSSTSSSSPPSPNKDSAVADESQPPHSSVVGESTSPSPPSFSSYFSDIKERLRSPPSPPRRIPTDPPPPSAFTAAKPAPTASLEEIRRHLAEFRVKSGGPSSGSRPSSDTQLSFQDILKSNVLGKPGSGADATGGEASTGLSLESIRESLRKFRVSPRDGERHTQSSTFNIKAFQDSLRKGMGGGESGPQLIGTDKPLSIFGKEGIEKKKEGEDVGPKVRRTEFVKMYGYEELGEKLRKLRPEKDEKTGESFSLIELNDRLAKLRELEETETESRLGGVSFRDLRESLQRLRDADASKKANMHRLSIFTNLGQATPTFMLKPPQEHLLEKYFHPDHMSSAEKLKLELQSVRDEFKMSENDCGSARLQVAQLTTKIKHLSATLHKKDKHSRKGLQGMVQHRKKLLKYLRRTDWDSYCLVLSKLGLRDVPEYKIPHKSL